MRLVHAELDYNNKTSKYLINPDHIIEMFQQKDNYYIALTNDIPSNEPTKITKESFAELIDRFT